MGGGTRNEVELDLSPEEEVEVVQQQVVQPLEVVEVEEGSWVS